MEKHFLHQRALRNSMRLHHGFCCGLFKMRRLTPKCDCPKHHVKCSPGWLNMQEPTRAEFFTSRPSLVFRAPFLHAEKSFTLIDGGCRHLMWGLSKLLVKTSAVSNLTSPGEGWQKLCDCFPNIKSVEICQWKCWKAVKDSQWNKHQELLLSQK